VNKAESQSSHLNGSSEFSVGIKSVRNSDLGSSKLQSDGAILKRRVIDMGKFSNPSLK